MLPAAVAWLFCHDVVICYNIIPSILLIMSCFHVMPGMQIGHNYAGIYSSCGGGKLVCDCLVQLEGPVSRMIVKYFLGSIVCA